MRVAPLFSNRRDSRKRPFDILLSGTLELLPLVMGLAQLAVIAQQNEGSTFQTSLWNGLCRRTRVERVSRHAIQFGAIGCMDGIEAVSEMSYMITTHSPYILSSFNNLLEAWQVGHADEERGTAVRAVIDEKYWVNPDDFARMRLRMACSLQSLPMICRR